jgi:hypothetical protein
MRLDLGGDFRRHDLPTRHNRSVKESINWNISGSITGIITGHSAIATFASFVVASADGRWI